MRKRRLMNEINVVPYIDVMLVLLVIFMVTAPMIQTGVVELPSVDKASMVKAEPIEVVVRADATLGIGAGAGEVQTVDRKQLLTQLRALQQKDGQRPVLIAGDKAVRYESVLDVMGLLQREGIDKIGLLVQPGAK